MSGNEGMPPLGPPYAPSEGGSPPRPTYPPGPPNQWSIPPVITSPPPAGPPPERGWTASQRRLFAIVAGITAAVVLLGLLVFDSTNDDDFRVARTQGTPRSTTTTTDPPTTATTTPQLDQVLDDIERFVEQERGLTFKTPPQVALAEDAEFEQRLLKDFDEQLPQIREDQEVLTALGLLSPGTDLVASLRTLLQAQVVGFYDPETKELVVRGGEATPYVRQVLAHELTHALDDQYFELNRPQLDNADDETGFGFTALAEGDARRVEEAYVATFTSGERASAAAEEVRLMLAHPEVLTIPSVVQEILAEPYRDGPDLIDALLRAGGRDRLDQAFTAPPTTSEQVLDPTKFLANEGAMPLPTPAADGPVAANGVIGAFIWQRALGRSLSDEQADRAITGWGGDSYVIWEDGTRACLRDTIVGDTPADTDELRQALQAWATELGAQVTGTPAEPVTVTVCT